MRQVKIHPWSHLIRVIVAGSLLIGVLIAAPLLWETCFEAGGPGGFAVSCLIVLAAAVCVKLGSEGFLFWLDRHGKRAMRFDERQIQLGDRTIYLSTVRFRYVTLELSLLAPDFVMPKLLIIPSKESPLICYLSKRTLRKLTDELGYDVEVA